MICIMRCGMMDINGLFSLVNAGGKVAVDQTDKMGLNGVKSK